MIRIMITTTDDKPRSWHTVICLRYSSLVLEDKATAITLVSELVCLWSKFVVIKRNFFLISTNVLKLFNVFVINLRTKNID